MKVIQSCLTLCNPMVYTVHGILQARILEWVAYPFSSRSSRPRNWTRVSCIAGNFFTCNFFIWEAPLSSERVQITQSSCFLLLLLTAAVEEWPHEVLVCAFQRRMQTITRTWAVTLNFQQGAGNSVWIPRIILLPLTSHTVHSIQQGISKLRTKLYLPVSRPLICLFLEHCYKT